MKEAHAIFLVTTPTMLLNETFKTCECQIRMEVTKVLARIFTT